ncbi:MAG: ATP-binding protein [Pseudomonadota bacterium]
MFWYTFRIESALTHLVEKDIVALQSAEELEMAIISQKGFVTYYFLDNDPEWLKQLGEYRQIFKKKLEEVKLISENESQKKIIENIEKEYGVYIGLKDRVISYYIAGKRKEGAKLHKDVRNQFFKIIELCDEYKIIHVNRVALAKENSHNEAIQLRYFAVSALIMSTFLIIMMGVLLVKGILKPIYRLAMEAGRESNTGSAHDEIAVLVKNVRDLINDFDLTHFELEKSREHLQQSEKMALVGKLAAGMAHSIRNPFTSVKMRLFSLERSKNFTETQQDDIKVISDEIRQMDTIVQNFLEFSRPPKLKMQKISPSLVVDLAIQLLEHRIKSYDVTVKIVREKNLPEIDIDPEQLKEVIVNLMINSCEAMIRGGLITIYEYEDIDTAIGKAVVLKFSDNGPGIPKSFIAKIMEPFFTTKEEGTGLGLSIVTRIIEEHGGRIDVESKEREGAAFIITLPAKDKSKGKGI